MANLKEMICGAMVVGGLVVAGSNKGYNIQDLTSRPYATIQNGSGAFFDKPENRDLGGLATAVAGLAIYASSGRRRRN